MCLSQTEVNITRTYILNSFLYIYIFRGNSLFSIHVIKLLLVSLPFFPFIAYCPYTSTWSVSSLYSLVRNITLQGIRSLYVYNVHGPEEFVISGVHCIVGRCEGGARCRFNHDAISRRSVKLTNVYVLSKWYWQKRYVTKRLHNVHDCLKAWVTCWSWIKTSFFFCKDVPNQ